MLPNPFNMLPENARSKIQRSRSTIIFRQGDRPTAIYYLISGSVVLIRHTNTGDKVVIHRATSGGTFAEAALFSDAFHCDAVVESDAEIIVLNRPNILEAMRQNQEFGIALTKRFAQQVQAYRQRLEIQAIRSADERVLSALRAGMLADDIGSMAGQIGLTREATYRALRALTDRGAVKKLGHGKYTLVASNLA